jgi:hypothetical protein
VRPHQAEGRLHRVSALLEHTREAVRFERRPSARSVISCRLAFEQRNDLGTVIEQLAYGAASGNLQEMSALVRCELAMQNNDPLEPLP